MDLFSKNNIFNKEIIKDFMLTSKNLIKFTKFVNDKEVNKLEKNFIKQNKINKNNKNNDYKNINKIKIKPTIFSCHLNDKLFWCFYVIKMGLDDYENLNNQYFIKEKEMKFKFIENLRSNKPLLKANKIKPLYELEDDLANKDKISLKTFIAICLINNVNIVIIDDKKMYENLVNINDQIYIINKTEDLKFINYTLDLEFDKYNEKLEIYRKNKFLLPNIDYKLKALTAYKLDDLIEIAQKLDINLKNDNNKKKTKKEIYDLLIQNF